MINIARILLFTGILALFQNPVNAQENQRYLSNVGLVDSLYSEVLNESREIYVQVPDSYYPESKRKYPVIYILDGEVFLPTVRNVHEFYYGGFMPEMILVGISNSTNRTRDLTTSKVSTNHGMPFNEPNGEGKVPCYQFQDFNRPLLWWFVYSL
jgi:predicted alpha/beta superfamily hydrolase